MKIGVDLTTISRFENKDELFAKRLLSDNEYHIFKTLQDSNKPLFLARSFAIKEAIFKADNDFVEFSKIDLVKKNNKWTFKDFEISISHENDQLVAFVIKE